MHTYCLDIYKKYIGGYINFCDIIDKSQVQKKSELLIVAHVMQVGLYCDVFLHSILIIYEMHIYSETIDKSK